MRLISILALGAGLALAWPGAVAAEGEILLATSVPGANPPINAPTFGPSPNHYGPGPSYQLRLYWLKEGGVWHPISDPQDFRTTSITASRYILPVTVAVPGTVPGQEIWVALALEHRDYPGRRYAVSNIIKIVLGGGGQPPAPLSGIHGPGFPLGNVPRDFGWRVANEVKPQLPENTTRVIDGVADGDGIVVAVERVTGGVTNHALVRINADGTADETYPNAVPDGGRVRELYSPNILIGEFPGELSVLGFHANGQLAWSFG